MQSYDVARSSVTKQLAFEEDVKDIKKAELHFKTDCATTRTLAISLNDKKIYSEANVCGDTFIELKNLKQENVLTFSSDGNYYIYDLYARAEMYTDNFPVYYFAISKEDADKIREGSKLAMLNTDFATTDNKNLTFSINNFDLNIETNKAYYQTPVNKYLKQGINKIRILPEKPLIVLNTTLTLE
jgi:hypothetical protein